jgi:hypothetical protein
VFHDTPASADAALIAKLRRVSSPLRDRVATEWKRDGGEEVVRYCVELSIVRGELDEALFARMLDDPYEAFLVHYGDFPDDRLEVFDCYADAHAFAEANSTATTTAALAVVKGDEAEAYLAEPLRGTR